MDDYCLQIMDVLKECPRGLMIKEISCRVGLSSATVAKKLDVLEALGKIERENVGSAIKNYARVSGRAHDF